jgi:hypothetical protein
LLEQEQVDAASLRLTIHIEGVPTVVGSHAAPLRTPQTSSPILVVTRPGTGMPALPATVNRLSAVSLPPYAQREVSELHLERMKLLEEFESPHNLRVVEFAKLAGKSRRWISYEISARNLLALSIGNRGLRVPDWHLDPVKHSLIQTMLRQGNPNPWRLYHALSRPHDDLNGRAPIEAVTLSTMRRVISVVQRQLNEAGEEVDAIRVKSAGRLLLATPPGARTAVRLTPAQSLAPARRVG